MTACDESRGDCVAVPWQPLEPRGWAEETARVLEAHAPKDDGSNDRAVDLVGNCPRCQGHMQARIVYKPGIPWFPLDLLCNCSGSHAGRPEDVFTGCGAGGQLKVTWPKPDGQPHDRLLPRLEARRLGYHVSVLVEWQRRAEQAELEALPKAKASAEKWVGGIGTMLGLFATVSLVTEPSDISKLSTGWAIVVAVLVLSAVACALFAFNLCAEAAWGRGHYRGGPYGGQMRRHNLKIELPNVEKSLRRSRIATIVGVVFAIAAVMVTWFMS